VQKKSLTDYIKPNGMDIINIKIELKSRKEGNWKEKEKNHNIKIELKSRKEGNWKEKEKDHWGNLFCRHNYILCIGSNILLGGVYVTCCRHYYC
jgi:hypothetical protein